MALNTNPIFSLTPVIDGSQISGAIASARSDGVGKIGTDMIIIISGSASGSFVQKLRVSANATTPTNMTATVIRFFITSTGSNAQPVTLGISSSTNNTFLLAELATAAVPAANAANSINYYDIPMNFALPAGYMILGSIHANLAANTEWDVLAFGGDYL
jgi:hypothetical protein